MGSSLWGDDDSDVTVKGACSSSITTPATAQETDSSGQLSAEQQEAKSRLRGIRSTYNRFNETSDTSSDGTTNKLG